MVTSKRIIFVEKTKEFDKRHTLILSAMHFHIRGEGRIVKKAVYIALGIDMEGRIDVLGMYVGENESVKFWL